MTQFLSQSNRGRSGFKRPRRVCVSSQLVERAVRSQASAADAVVRAARFKDKYLARLRELRKYPW